LDERSHDILGGPEETVCSQTAKGQEKKKKRERIAVVDWEKDWREVGRKLPGQAI
jgi:hypothetical protein